MQGVFFRVDGADIESGQETFLILRAASSDEAEELARKQGMLIASVRPANDADWQAMPAAGAVKVGQAKAAPQAHSIFADSKPVTTQTRTSIQVPSRGEAGKPPAQRPPHLPRPASAHRVPPPARPAGFHPPATRTPANIPPLAPVARVEVTPVIPPSVAETPAARETHWVAHPEPITRHELPSRHETPTDHEVPAPLVEAPAPAAPMLAEPPAAEPAIWEHATSLVAGSVVLATPPAIEHAIPAPAPAVVPTPAIPTPPAAPIPDAAPVAIPRPPTGSGWLASIILSPLAFLSLAGGVALLVYSLNRAEPADATDLQKLDLHVQSLTQSFLGGMLILAGLLLFVAAGLVYVGGGLRSLRRE